MFPSYPDQQGLFNGPDQYRPTKGLMVRVLEDYLKVATNVLPSDTKLSRPSLWHPDLHGNSIFVDPLQPTKIVSIIDWQAANISPLFLQVDHPKIIAFEGPIPSGLKLMHLPDNFDRMTGEEQRQAKDLLAAQSLYKLYDIFTLEQCPDIGYALQFQDNLFANITRLAGSVFSDEEPILEGMLIRLQDEWTKHAKSATTCPLTYIPDNRARHKELEASWRKGVKLMDDVLGEMGAYHGWDGWVNQANYAVYKDRLARCRENFLNQHAKTEEERGQWIRAWPFEEKAHSPTSLYI